MNYGIVAIVVILLVVSIVNVVYLLKTKNKESLNFDQIVLLFNKKDIIGLDYIRNKIVVTFKDVQLFNVETLKANGAKGINIVGDKIKFFVSSDNTLNERIFHEINKVIEG